MAASTFQEMIKEKLMRGIIILSLLFMGSIVDAKTMSFEDVKTYLANEENHVLEPGHPPMQTSQDLAFLCYVAEDWRRALTLLEKIASDRRQQSMITVAAEFLPARDYVRFLNGTCDLISSGKIEMPGWGFGCGSFIKQGFLGYNYDQPEVATVINRLEVIYKAQKPEDWNEYFSSVKSGENKKETVKLLTAYGDPMPETYKANSKEIYKALVREHKKQMAEEAKKAKSKTRDQSDSEEGKTTTNEENNISKNETAESKSAPWKIPLLIGVIIAGGVVAVWRRFRK